MEVFLEYVVRDQSNFIFLQVAIQLFKNQLFKSTSAAYWYEKPDISSSYFPYVSESASGISILFSWSTWLFILSIIPFYLLIFYSMS